MKIAYFAGGCFWCIAALLDTIEGVHKIVSGYSGGDEINPTYEDVKAQKTGHRESIKVIYDEQITSYKTILEMFLNNIDPFDAGGQFIDRGHSYTTAIYYTNQKELDIAKDAINKIEKESGKKSAVALEPFKSFYDAEEYHQNFHLKHPDKIKREMIESGRSKKIEL